MQRELSGFLRRVLLATLFRLRFVRRLMFLTVSQTAVNYRRGPLSHGAAGRVRGGDRLPWIAPEVAGPPGTTSPG